MINERIRGRIMKRKLKLADRTSVWIDVAILNKLRIGSRLIILTTLFSQFFNCFLFTIQQTYGDDPSNDAAATFTAQRNEVNHCDDFIEKIALILPKVEPYDVCGKSYDELSDHEKKQILERYVVYAKRIDESVAEYEKYPISDVAEPIFLKERSMFEVIRDSARDVSYDPIDSLYAYRGSPGDAPLRIRLTFERFVPYCKFREAAYNASEDEIRECVDRLSEFTDEELVFVLSAFHIYLLRNCYIPEYLYKKRFTTSRTIGGELRRVRSDNACEDLTTLYLNKTARRPDDVFVKTLEDTIDSYVSNEAIINDLEVEQKRPSSRLSQTEYDEFYASIKELFRHVVNGVDRRKSYFPPNLMFAIEAFFQENEKKRQNAQNGGRASFPYENYAFIIWFSMVETRRTCCEDDVLPTDREMENYTGFRLFRKYIANLIPNSDGFDGDYSISSGNVDNQPRTLGDVARTLVEQRKEFKWQTQPKLIEWREAL